ncbi:MAG: hypothetical protein IT210_13135 [Armatimonadetes bacterium]|nr:hypothetical protein [Armatimonadota bacterium]
MMKQMAISAMVILIQSVCPTQAAAGELLPSLTLSGSRRPSWVRDQGIVMAGNWDPMVSRSAFNGYVPTPEQRALYEKEHSLKTLQALRQLGVNFIMTHCYKGAGIEAEKEDMEIAQRFAVLCRQQGFHVGAYVTSSTLYWELLDKERPDAPDWLVRDIKGNHSLYLGNPLRRRVNQNHPDYQAYLKRVVEFAVNEMKLDLLHFDNWYIGPGFDRVSVERFRDYLKREGSALDFGVSAIDRAMPPAPPTPPSPIGQYWAPGNTLSDASPDTPLGRAWLDFSCESLSMAYHDMALFARTLRSDILMECNPAGVAYRIMPPVYHGQLLQYGEAFWDEQSDCGYQEGDLRTRIRTYRIGQTMDNMVFFYVTSPLRAAESLAFNTDCFGCIAWFEWGKITSQPDSNTPVSPEVLPYVRFFREQRPYYRASRRLPEVAILRSYTSQLYGSDRAARSTYNFEKSCIERSIPWAMIFDQHLADLKGFRALCLTGAESLSDRQVAQIQAYARQGGGLILAPGTGQYNEKMQVRSTNPFSDLKSRRIVQVTLDAGQEDILAAIKRACETDTQILLDAPPYLLAEITQQDKPGRRLVHLVNYNTGVPVTVPRIDLQVPKGWRIRQVALLRPEDPQRRLIEFRQEKDRVRFAIPKMDGYALVSVETKAQ